MSITWFLIGLTVTLPFALLALHIRRTNRISRWVREEAEHDRQYEVDLKGNLERWGWEKVPGGWVPPPGLKFHSTLSNGSGVDRLH